MSAVEDAAQVLARWQYEQYDSHFSMPGGLSWEAYLAADREGAEAVYLTPAHMMAEALASAGLLRDGETRVEWGVEHHDGFVGGPVDESDARRAVEDWPATSRRAVFRTVTSYPDTVGEWEVQS